MTIEPPLEASRFPSHSIPATEQTHVNIYYSTPGNARSDALRWHTEEYRSWRSEAEEKAGQQQWQPCFHTTGDSMEEGLGESTASLRTPSAIKNWFRCKKCALLALARQDGLRKMKMSRQNAILPTHPTRFLLSTHYQSFALCDRQMYSGYDSDSDSIPTF